MISLADIVLRIRQPGWHSKTFFRLPFHTSDTMKKTEKKEGEEEEQEQEKKPTLQCREYEAVLLNSLFIGNQTRTLMLNHSLKTQTVTTY